MTKLKFPFSSALTMYSQEKGNYLAGAGEVLGRKAKPNKTQFVFVICLSLAFSLNLRQSEAKTLCTSNVNYANFLESSLKSYLLAVWSRVNKCNKFKSLYAQLIINVCKSQLSSTPQLHDFDTICQKVRLTRKGTNVKSHPAGYV